MDNSWKHIKTVLDGENFQIDGLNIWEYHWKGIGRKIFVKDPLYGQTHTMEVYEIETDNLNVRFAAGEFSICVWGIYQQQ